MESFRIGLIASLSGPKQRIGLGILHSVEFIFALSNQPPFQDGPRIELVVEDDRGQVFDAIKAMHKCVDADCVMIIGPNDTDSATALLADERFRGVPMLSLANGTDIAPRNGAPNLFRVTSPNSSRVELLLMKIKQLMNYPALRGVKLHKF